jgi:hypothetical protein
VVGSNPFHVSRFTFHVEDSNWQLAIDDLQLARRPEGRFTFLVSRFTFYAGSPFAVESRTWFRNGLQFTARSFQPNQQQYPRLVEKQICSTRGLGQNQRPTANWHLHELLSSARGCKL